MMRKTCAVCGRPLTNPESVSAGIGPVCYAHTATVVDEATELNEYMDIPLSSGIRMERRTAGTATNIRRRVVHHSPDGFEWGYGGSGPADLALNIAQAILLDMGHEGEKVECHKGSCFAAAWDMHQDLKWKFVGGVPSEGGVIPYKDISEWINSYLLKNQPLPNEEEA